MASSIHESFDSFRYDLNRPALRSTPKTDQAVVEVKEVVQNVADGIKDALDARPNEKMRDLGEDIEKAAKDIGRDVKDAVKEE